MRGRIEARKIPSGPADLIRQCPFPAPAGTCTLLLPLFKLKTSASLRTSATDRNNLKKLARDQGDPGYLRHAVLRVSGVGVEPTLVTAPVGCHEGSKAFTPCDPRDAFCLRTTPAMHCAPARIPPQNYNTIVRTGGRLPTDDGSLFVLERNRPSLGQGNDQAGLLSRERGPLVNEGALR